MQTVRVPFNIKMSFRYKNHKDEVSDRTIIVESLDYIQNPGFGYEAGWFICGICEDRKQRRSFALSNIVRDDSDHVHRIQILMRPEGY